jgi:hypothetical protein
MLMVMVGLAAALSATPAPVDGLLLNLETNPATILVGQSTTAIVTWSSRAPIRVTLTAVDILVDDGSGFKEFVDADTDTEGIGSPIQLSPGNPQRTFHILGLRGGTGDDHRSTASFLFAKPGKYQVKARYSTVDADGNPIRTTFSNTIAITVQIPTGKDAELFSQALSSSARLLLDASARDQVTGAQFGALMSKYPGSPYLARSAIPYWNARINEAKDKDRKASATKTWPETRALLQKVAATTFVGSGFDDDRLNLLASEYESIGDPAAARAVYAELAAKYRNGAFGSIAADWLRAHGDDAHDRDHDKDCPDHDKDGGGAHDCRDFGQQHHDEDHGEGRGGH